MGGMIRMRSYGGRLQGRFWRYLALRIGFTISLKVTWSRNGHEASAYRNIRYSPFWSFRWDNRTHIEDIVENMMYFYHHSSGNATSELKSSADTETDGLFDGERPVKIFPSSQWKKSYVVGGSDKSKCIAAGKNGTEATQTTTLATPARQRQRQQQQQGEFGQTVTEIIQIAVMCYFAMKFFSSKKPADPSQLMSNLFQKGEPLVCFLCKSYFTSCHICSICFEVRDGVFDPFLAILRCIQKEIEAFSNRISCSFLDCSIKELRNIQTLNAPNVVSSLARELLAVVL